MNELLRAHIPANKFCSFNILNKRAAWLQSQGETKRGILSAITLGKSVQLYGVPYQLIS